MALYDLQRAIYDFLDPRREAHVERVVFAPEGLRSRYCLDEAEARALLEVDVPALHRLGVHPVLINAYARARVPFAAYRATLAAMGREAPGNADAPPLPWQPLVRDGR